MCQNDIVGGVLLSEIYHGCCEIGDEISVIICESEKNCNLIVWFGGLLYWILLCFQEAVFAIQYSIIEHALLSLPVTQYSTFPVRHRGCWGTRWQLKVFRQLKRVGSHLGVVLSQTYSPVLVSRPSDLVVHMHLGHFPSRHLSCGAVSSPLQTGPTGFDFHSFT